MGARFPQESYFMRALTLLAALCLPPMAALAQDNPSPKKIAVPDAASLIGKKVAVDRQFEIGSNATKIQTGDWSYGFDYDDPGLERTASTKERGKDGAAFDTYHLYDTRCAPGDKAAPFAFGAGDHFPLKGSMAKGQYADAWIYLGDKDTYDDKALKLKMDFSQNDAAMHFALDPAILAPRDVAAICPTAAPPGKAGGHCAIFSLKGFARAYDFVCNAK
jgi:hypothetical protein